MPVANDDWSRAATLIERADSVALIWNVVDRVATELGAHPLRWVG